MSAKTGKDHTMVDRADAEAVLYRAAFTAVRFGGEVSEAQLDQDVSWCLQPLGELDSADQQRLRVMIAALARDPTAHRGALNATLASLVD